MTWYDYEDHTQRDLERFSKADEYTLRHLAAHLSDAGQREKLYRLLIGNQAWMQTKVRHLRTGLQEYGDEVDAAIGDFEDPLTEDGTLVLVQLCTARQLTNTLNMGDIDLQILVWLGQESEATRFAQKRSTVSEKCCGLLAIYAAKKRNQEYDTSILSAILETGLVFDRSSRKDEFLKELSTTLAESISEGRKATYQEIEIALVMGVISPQDEGNRDTSRGKTVNAATESDNGTVLPQDLLISQATEIALAIDDVPTRIGALQSIATFLTKSNFKASSDLFEQAVELAKKIQSEATRLNILLELAKGLLRVGSEAAEEVYEIARQGIVQPAEMEVKRLEQDIDRYWDFDPDLRHLGKQVEAAENEIREIRAETSLRTGELHKIWALDQMIARLVQTGQICPEAFPIIQTIQDKEKCLEILTDLAIEMVKAEAASSREIFKLAWETALELRSIPTLKLLVAALAQSNRAEADKLFNQARELDLAGADLPDLTQILPKIVATLCQIEEYALARKVAGAIDNGAVQAQALTDLALRMLMVDASGAFGVVQSAYQAAKAIGDEYERAQALTNLAAALLKFDRRHTLLGWPPDIRPQAIVQSAYQAAQGIENEKIRVIVLGDLAARMRESGAVEAEYFVEKAFQAAKEIKDRWDSSLSIRYLIDYFREMSEPGASGGVVQSACQADRTIEVGGWQAQILRDLAPALIEGESIDKIADRITRLDRAQDGLAICILWAITKVAGWSHPKWKEIHNILAAG